MRAAVLDDVAQPFSIEIVDLEPPRARGPGPRRRDGDLPFRPRCAGRLGATHTIDSREGEVTERLLEPSGGSGIGIDTTGLQPVMTAGFQALSVRGTLGVLGVSPPGTRVDRRPVGDAPRPDGSREHGRRRRPGRVHPVPARSLRAGQVPLDRLIENCGGLDQINDAIEAIESGDVVKAVLSVAG